MTQTGRAKTFIVSNLSHNFSLLTISIRFEDKRMLIRGIEKLTAKHTPCVATIGNFDGVHLGHQHVINTLLERSQCMGLKSTVITFEPLAKEFFKPNSIDRLTTVEQRAELLAQLGVDQVLCIDFDADFAAYSPKGFVHDVLIDGLGVKHLSVGDDFKFGKGRAGDFAMLQSIGAEHDFTVTAHDTFEIDGQRVSSGRIRVALNQSNFDLAEALLGRPYSVSGNISKGQQRGRTINYPTANIILPLTKSPLSGVFAVLATLSHGQVLSGVANLGTRPTVGGKENRLEVHLFDFNQDIYGQELQVRFVDKIRDELKFDSFEALTEQIHKDAERAREILSII